MKKPLSNQLLNQQNVTFKNTGGVSEGNKGEGFRPAFYDTQQQRAEIARFANGTPAPFHLLEGVPEDWVTKRDSCGKVIAVKVSVIAGFIRNGIFYTRDQASCLCAWQA